MNEILSKNIIKEFGLDALPAEKQEEVILKIGGVLQKRLMLRALGELEEKEKDEFDNLLGEKPDDQDAAMGFLRAKIPHLDDILKEEVAAFKTEMMKVAGKSV